MVKEEYKIGKYADDTFLLLDGTVGSIRGAFKILDDFGKISGLCVNREKTQAVWLGNRAGELTDICPDIKMNWSTEFTILGLDMSCDLLNIETRNYEKILSKIKGIIKIHSKRNLTLIGRITIIKSLIISQMVHVLSVFPTPDKTLLKELHKILRNFIWHG